MPTYPYLYADDLVATLKKKHAMGTYKSMVTKIVLLNMSVTKIVYPSHKFTVFPLLLKVFYLEACESGSIFEGLLPEDINIYATTASNAVESSWGTYCPGEYPSPPPEYWTCLGDLYSVSWMEDR